jgi:multiple sugar transport system ATP-binding protein
MPTIALEKVSKLYENGFEAVRELDLEVADGEFMVLVGPSGCGKTSVLRMIAGLEQISEGNVRIGDVVVNDVAPKSRDIAMVFQNYALYPHMTVGENIGFALKMRGLSKQDIGRKVNEAAAVIGLEDLIDQKPGRLSGGQRQRVAMGRAIVREPSVFLMDEPLSNLDAKLRVQMRAEVAKVQRRLGVATVYVTHDQTEAMTMGHRVAVLRDGVLQQCARPQTLYDEPANVFVAAFIGSPAMNLFEASLGESAAQVIVGNHRLDLSPAELERRPRLRAYANKPVILGIRPEDLSVDGGDAGSAAATITGEVELVEALGSELLVHFTATARGIDAERAVQSAAHEAASGITGAGSVARVEPHVRVDAGSHVSFRVNTDKLQFFDAGSGEAIR